MRADFLISSERSGSNLITRMFDCHPACCGPAPAHLIRILVENRANYGNLKVPENWAVLCRDAADIMATQVGRWRTEPAAEDLIGEVAPRTLPSLVRHVLGTEARAWGKRRLFVKENQAWRLLPFLLAHWTDAHFVLLVRDPRDMALSWKRSAVHRGDVVRAARVWHGDQAGALAAAAQLRDSGRFHLVTYESLTADPEGELRRLCLALDLDFAPQMVAIDRAPNAVQHAESTVCWENLARPVLGANTRKFREALADVEIALVEAICGPEMIAFGYEPEARDRRPLAELEAELAPRERLEKPEYLDQPAAEREQRARREEVVHRIRARAPVAPVIAAVGS